LHSKTPEALAFRFVLHKTFADNSHPIEDWAM
jgi:hypothetical protein